jgi:cytochrome c peroxidase
MIWTNLNSARNGWIRASFSLALALACLLATPHRATAENASGTASTESHDSATGAILHAQHMRSLFRSEHGNQPTPLVIPKMEIDRDPNGTVATYQPGGPTLTSRNAFFADLGTNGRTCFTCHQPAEGWTISATGARARFERSLGSDPLFRLFDGATCPSDDLSSLDDQLAAYSLLINKGLIRLGLSMPKAPQFEMIKVDDPYDCTTNSSTGLTGSTTGIVSIYRRPLPATNLGFLSTIMWDGREPDLASQAVDATLIHAQATSTPSKTQQEQIVSFESGIFTAQNFDVGAHNLYDGGARGGPKILSAELAKFFIGINDPLGMNPRNEPFDPKIFNIYDAWESLPGQSNEILRRQSIARGEALFNTKPIFITGVAGLNDTLNQDIISGTCGTCHNSPNVGDRSVKALMNIGTANAGAHAPPTLDISGLPVFTLKCTSGPLAQQQFTVTDPGRALITGDCADIGKVKSPTLRGLASRAPYFHNGSAATLNDVVVFYDQRFTMELREEEKNDLVNFLNAL